MNSAGILRRILSNFEFRNPCPSAIAIEFGNATIRSEKRSDETGCIGGDSTSHDQHARKSRFRSHASAASAHNQIALELEHTQRSRPVFSRSTAPALVRTAVGHDQAGNVNTSTLLAM